MTDLVKRLRGEARPKGTGNYRDELWHEAADEIEKLRAALKLALPELELIGAGEVCDHSVNICYCSLHTATEAVRNAITNS